MPELTVDLKGKGVIVTAALVLNPRTTVLLEAKPQMLSRYPMQRPGAGDDIAKAVLYFMAADWVTGEVTDVNGGYYID